MLRFTSFLLAAGLFVSFASELALAEKPALGPQVSAASHQIKEVQVANGAFERGTQLPRGVEQIPLPPADTSQPAVIRLADRQYLIDEKPLVFVHYAISINDPSVLADFGQLPLEFVPEYQKLELHAVKLIRGKEILDRTKTATVRFLQKDSSLAQGMYSDVVTASVLVEDIRLGDTIEYAYSVIGQNPVFDGKFLADASWDQRSPVSRSRVSLSYPASRKINWRLVGDGPDTKITPVETVSDGRRKLVFEATSMPAKSPENLAPLDYLPTRWLQFSEFTNWNEVAKWAVDLFRSDGTASTELQQEIDQLKSASSDQERVIKALEFVQNEIRYFSIALGENSHRPASPEVVIKRRYGDCKDKALLLVTLLRAVGIDARPVLLSVNRRKGLDKTLPSPLSFDHAIARVNLDKRDYYLDATRLGQHGRLARLGQAHEGSQVLVIDGETQELATISSPNISDLVRSDATETLHLSDLSGDATMQSVLTWNGVEAEGMRVLSQQVSAEQLKRVLLDAVAKIYPGASATGNPSIDDDRSNNVFSVAAEYRLPKVVQEMKPTWYVRITPVNLTGILGQTASGSRSSPLAMPYFPFEGNYTLITELPSTAHFPPDKLKHSTKGRFFNYDASSNYRGNTVTTNISLKTLVAAIEPQDLASYTAILRACAILRAQLS